MAAPLLEFRHVGPGLEEALGRFFTDLSANGDDLWFHPHPLTAEHAAELCAYDGQDLYYVGVAGGKVLAYGLLRGWDEGYEVPSLGIAVHPQARGLGLSRPFMHFLHAASLARGAKQVRLKVYPDNKVARQLYESLGYRFETTKDKQLLGLLDLGQLAGRADQARRRLRANFDWAAVLGPVPAGPRKDPEEKRRIWAALRKLHGQPDEEFVRGCFQAVLGRPADAGAVKYFRDQLAAGFNRIDLAASLVNSAEGLWSGLDDSWLAPLEAVAPGGLQKLLRKAWRAADAEFGQELYELLLARPARPGEQATLVADLAAGRPRIDIVRALATGSEGAEAGLGPDWLEGVECLSLTGVLATLRKLWTAPADDFIRGSCRAILGREIDDDGLDFFRNRLAEGERRSELICTLANAPEAREAGLDDTWLSVLQRVAPADLVKHLRKLLHAPERLFLRESYLLLLGRDATPSEAHVHLDALAAGASRAHLVQALAVGPDGVAAGLNDSWRPWLDGLAGDTLWTALRKLWPAPDDDFIRAAYRLLFAREADPSGLAYQKEFLASGFCRADLVRTMAQNPEAEGLDDSWLVRLKALSADAVWGGLRRLWSAPDEELVRGLYQLLFGFDADPAGLDAHLATLAAGATRTDLVQAMANSQEAAGLDTSWLERLHLLSGEAVWAELRQLWSATDEEFVRGLYPLLVGREASPEECAHARADLTASGRSQVVRDLAESDEAAAAGLDTSWLKRLHLLSGEAVWAGLCDLWPATDEAFVRGLYRLLLVREVDPDELGHALADLADLRHRVDLVQEQATCPEAVAAGLDASWLPQLAELHDPFAGQPLAEKGPARQELLFIPDNGEFVRRAYRLLLHREAGEAEVERANRRLRLWPKVMRRLFLARLFRSPERRRLVRRLRLDEICGRLDRSAARRLATLAPRLAELERRLEDLAGRRSAA